MTVLDLLWSMECGRSPKELLSLILGGSAASMVLRVPCCVRAGHSQQYVVCPLLGGY